MEMPDSVCISFHISSDIHQDGREATFPILIEKVMLACNAKPHLH
jgi:hypothetical protein